MAALVGLKWPHWSTMKKKPSWQDPLHEPLQMLPPMWRACDCEGGHWPPFHNPMTARVPLCCKTSKTVPATRATEYLVAAAAKASYVHVCIR